MLARRGETPTGRKQALKALQEPKLWHHLSKFLPVQNVERTAWLNSTLKGGVQNLSCHDGGSRDSTGAFGRGNSPPRRAWRCAMDFVGGFEHRNSCRPGRNRRPAFRPSCE